MSADALPDGVFMQFVCQVLNLMVIQITVCQRFLCIVFVVPIAPTRITLDFPIPCLFRLAISMLCCAFAFLHAPYSIVSVTFKLATVPQAICFRCHA